MASCTRKDIQYRLWPSCFRPPRNVHVLLVGALCLAGWRAEPVEHISSSCTWSCGHSRLQDCRVQTQQQNCRTRIRHRLVGVAHNDLSRVGDIPSRNYGDSVPADWLLLRHLSQLATYGSSLEDFACFHLADSCCVVEGRYCSCRHRNRRVDDVEATMALRSHTHWRCIRLFPRGWRVARTDTCRRFQFLRRALRKSRSDSARRCQEFGSASVALLWSPLRQQCTWLHRTNHVATCIHGDLCTHHTDHGSAAILHQYSDNRRFHMGDDVPLSSSANRCRHCCLYRWSRIHPTAQSQSRISMRECCLDCFIYCCGELGQLSHRQGEALHLLGQQHLVDRRVEGGTTSRWPERHCLGHIRIDPAHHSS